MQRILVALLTVVVFAAGFGARAWTEGAPAVPAPPAPGAEFNPKSSEPSRGGPPRMSRTQMIATIEQYQKQIDSYRNRVDELDKEFETLFVPMLTADQKVIFADQQKRQRDMVARMKSQTGPKEVLTDDQIDFLRNNPLNNVLRMIQPRERADRLTMIYTLTPDQHAKALALLNSRRDGFLKLVDETANSSVRYSDLAQIAERIANPEILKQEAQEKQERQDRAKKSEEAKKTDPKK